MPTTRETVERFYAELFNGRRFDLIDELLTPDAVNHGPTDEPAREAVAGADRIVHESFSDAVLHVDDILVDGDKAAVRWTMTGTHDGDFLGTPATGKAIRMGATVVFGLRDGRIAELWPQLDFHGLIRQVTGA
ncbi:ester cyclase [Amycolatopsis sp. FDAARGOS 1241]|uniref:ester cyclase n=1 Tax=Amycolatopsis sp. FDAARGOS 1241 TaxID=2778070 RepID=UPI001950B072|nr:ester cyclase [Amycolatopsis sp. FDAARGOS 1241]QRP44712.1 ester cyclase [Amycolatopsis sp. FDAARGOS 1241]